MVRKLCVLAVIVAVGCGDDKPGGKFYNPKNKDAGADEKDSGSRDDAGPGDGPELKFTMPSAANDPNDDTVITSPLVTVHCRATRRDGKPKVDESSVSITLEKFDEDAKAEVKPPTTKVGADEYEAKFDVSSRPNGALKFTCAAKDAGTPPKSSTLALQTLLDLGPNIELQEPGDKGIYALRTPVVVKFKVSALPLADGDKEADVKDVKLLVSGMPQEISESGDAPGLYQTTVDFNDKTLFMVPPTSAEIVVTATNARTPEAVTRSVKADVLIDGAGPSIKVESPSDGSIVHGEVALKLTVKDVSGIKPGSVRAEINKDLLTITEWDIAADTYSATFDTRAFGLELTQLTINVTATDIVGNQATIGHLLRLDNVPPLISLDPPWVREWRASGPKYFCSEAFDPVGDDALSDGSKGDRSSLFRAVVMDDTNHSPGESSSYFAGVAESKVVLYAQVDPSVPLLIDTDGDNECDEINFDSVPEAQRPALQQLTAVPPRGSSWFSKTVSFNEPGKHVLQPSDAYCQQDPSGQEPPGPDLICGNTFPSLLTRVVAGQSEKSPAALFSMKPTNAGAGSDCVGSSWEIIPTVGEGWRCLAVRAEDTIGNIGVSAPLRVCFDDSMKASTPCANYMTDTRPNCTDGCVITAAQKYAPNDVWHQ